MLQCDKIVLILKKYLTISCHFNKLSIVKAIKQVFEILKEKQVAVHSAFFAEGHYDKKIRYLFKISRHKSKLYCLGLFFMPCK